LVFIYYLFYFIFIFVEGFGGCESEFIHESVMSLSHFLTLNPVSLSIGDKIAPSAPIILGLPGCKANLMIDWSVLSLTFKTGPQ